MPLWGCQSNQSTPNNLPPEEPYREDEQIRLKLFVEDLFQLEKSKQYGKLYDKYTSPAFQKSVSRRNFMRLSQCVETHLGELVDYERKKWQFQRKSSKGQVFHSIRLPVVRSSANLTEQFTMTADGLDYRLTGLYWLTKHKSYSDCIQQLQVPEKTRTQGDSTNSPQKPQAPEEKQAETQNPRPPSNH